jgi:hypothetical protein
VNRVRRGAGCSDQGKPRQIEAHAARVGTLVNDDVEFEILHRRIEILLDGRLEAMNFVDEQHIAIFEIGQQPGQIAGLFDSRPAGCL